MSTPRLAAVERVLPVHRDSFFLLGPRGTGKSTWIKTRYPEALTIDFLEWETARRFEANPGLLEATLAAQPDRTCVVIDEVQRVPEVLSEVHRLMELKGRSRLQFILTGSSARKLRRGGTDLLGGRAHMQSMHPFMACELGNRFQLDESLNLGMIPIVRASENPERGLQAYASLYLRQEVQAEGLVRSLGGFSRFLEVAAMAHGTMLNASALARDCEIGRRAAEGYLAVVEDLLMAFRLPMFTRRAKRRLIHHPKWYLFDPGLFRVLRPRGPLDTGQESEGAALEGLVAQHLRAWLSYGAAQGQLSYWRSDGGLEVDFVLYGASLFAGLEVKRSSKVDSRDLRGLRAFKDLYPEARVCLLYLGAQKVRMAGIDCVPVDSFLKSLTPSRPLPI